MMAVSAAMGCFVMLLKQSVLGENRVTTRAATRPEVLPFVKKIFVFVPVRLFLE
jgi:hypothetical protein